MQVRRQEHRHWVHVVGTPYDLQEWTRSDALEQGIGCPRIGRSETQTDTRSPCPACTYLNERDAPRCVLCNTPLASAAASSSFFGAAQEEEDKKIEIGSVMFNNRLFDRPFDLYDDEQDKVRTSIDVSFVLFYFADGPASTYQ